MLTKLRRDIILLIIFSFLVYNKCNSQWIQTNGPYGAVADGVMSAGSYIAVELDDYLGVKMTNGGTSWTTLGNGLPLFNENYDIAYIAPNYFITTSGSGVYKSTDNGNNWFAVNNGLPSNLQTYQLLVSGSNLFCGFFNTRGVYISSNQGNSWQDASYGLPFNISIRKMFQIGGTIYLLNTYSLQDTGGVFSSTNNGANWIRSSHNGLPFIGYSQINSITNKSNVLFATYYHNVYKSSNGGNDWQNVSNNLPDTTTKAITNDGTNLYVGTGIGLYKSSNDGISWFSSDNGLGGKFIFEIVPFNSDLYVATRWYGVYKSTNGAGNWIQFNNGIRNSYTNQLVSLNNTLITGSLDDNGIFLTNNNGNNWSASNGGFPQLPAIRSLFVNGQDIYAGLFVGNNAQVWKSTNTGSNWFNVSTGLPNAQIDDFTANSNGIYCATFWGIYKTTNNGVSWQATGMLSSSRDITSSGSNLIAGVNDSDIYFSTNTGTTWSEVTNGLPQGQYPYIYSIRSNGNKVFASIRYASTNGGVYFSSNNGLSWQYRNNGIAANTFMQTFIFYNNYVIAAGRKIYVSFDDGINWQDVSNNLTSEYDPNALVIAGSNIFAGTSGHAVWRRPISEIIGIQNISSDIPTSFKLKQNFPNPFNPLTQIDFDISKNSIVKLTVYNSIGKEINILVNEKLNAGKYRVDFNAENYPSGIYFYKLETDNFVETKKMVLIK